VKFGYAFVWVEDIERTLQFYEEAFGLKRRLLTDNGELGLYAEMETGEMPLSIADQKEARALVPDRLLKNNPAQPQVRSSSPLSHQTSKRHTKLLCKQEQQRWQSRRLNRGARPSPGCENPTAFWSRLQARSHPAKGRK
jgi:hypothetical protein